ncbi:hypothetical protein J8F10_05655 [Gemmata sp. G18]|uniref:Uncharacterized protein n=1 Tax=Gemmata palustris TaxID=2822762 RepID=A0ABS5BM30_9BACT|nr:hypothetical protein [Gemmata palustris]MBP3954768.1 hypothetical protein [Gemmata palustris]
MALALRFEDLIRAGEVTDHAELAPRARDPGRVSQIMALLHLAPDIQKALLFLTKVTRGRDPLVLRDLRPIAVTPDWRRQPAARCGPHSEPIARAPEPGNHFTFFGQLRLCGWCGCSLLFDVYVRNLDQ